MTDGAKTNARDAPGVPGYGLIHPKSFGDPVRANWGPEDWRAEFEDTRAALTLFLRAHDPLAVLAKTSMQFMVEQGIARRDGQPEIAQRIDQSSIELIQALVLAHSGPQRYAPISPNNFLRLWDLIQRNVYAFVRKQPENSTESDAEAYVSFRTRLHTIHYRNLFTREDCENALVELLNRFDPKSEALLGYRLSEAYLSLLRILSLVEQRFQLFGDRIRNLMTAPDEARALESIAFFAEATSTSEKLWRRASGMSVDIEGLRYLGYQISEMANSWVFRLPRSVLEDELSPKMLSVVEQLSIRRGELAGMNLDHIYMNNPVWSRPFIALEDDSLFAALPQMPLSFPFRIVEGLIQGHDELVKSYSDARAGFLEEEVARRLRRSMPSADVYEKVLWTDPDSGKDYENDVVAIIGNTVFLFEAKSGGISDSARRGSSLSLQQQIKRLYVEPAEQARRLENYLAKYQERAILTAKSSKERIDLRLGKPKIVYKFSICIEHIEPITSTKYHSKLLGLVSDEDAWAPVLSIGELQLIERFLDSEVSFFHYLTRRATIESLMDFEGDEQDLLSMYLSNGLYIDSSELQDNRISFIHSDAAVRKPKKPRKDRTVVELHGVHLPKFWFSTVRELYESQDFPNRFDVIQTVLNQYPPALMEFERRVRNWWRGKGFKKDLLIAKYEIGGHTFVLALHAMKKAPDSEEWHSRAREIASSFSSSGDVIDCVVFLYVKNSKEKTFDGVSFFRMGRHSGGYHGRDHVVSKSASESG